MKSIVKAITFVILSISCLIISPCLALVAFGFTVVIWGKSNETFIVVAKKTFYEIFGECFNPYSIVYKK